MAAEATLSPLHVPPASPPLDAHGTIGASFILQLSHPPLGLLTMVGLSGAFDGYDGSIATGHLIVNAMENTPDVTLLHVKPSRPLTFATLAKEVDEMVGRIGREHAIAGLQVTRIAWVVKAKGIPAKMRSGFVAIA